MEDQAPPATTDIIVLPVKVSADQASSEIAASRFSTLRLHVGIGLIMAFLVLNLMQYLNEISLQEPEARQIIMAQEMLFRRELTVPTLLSERVTPVGLFHAAVVALATHRLETISPLSARTISVVAFLGLSVLIFALLMPIDPKTAQLAFLILATNAALLSQFANWAGPEIFVAFLLLSTYFFYIVYPDFWLTGLISAVFMAAGLLTDPSLPLFFYPGLILWALCVKNRRRRYLISLFLHSLTALFLAAAWIWFFLKPVSAKAWVELWPSAGLFHLYPGNHFDLLHAMSLLGRTLAALLPWLGVMLYAFKRVSVESEIYRSSRFIFFIILLLTMLNLPDTNHLPIEAIPFFTIVAAFHIDPAKMIPHRMSSGLLLLFWLALAGGSTYCFFADWYSQGIIFAVISLACLMMSQFRFSAIGLTVILSVIGFTAYTHSYIFYQSLTQFDYRQAAKLIVVHAPEDLPIVIDSRIQSLVLAAYVEAAFKRPLHQRALPNFGDYYIVTLSNNPHPNGVNVMELKETPKGPILIQRVKHQRQSGYFLI